MSKIPFIVSTDWLYKRLDDPNIRILDATTFLRHSETGYYDIWSGKEAYDEAHIPGAVFADILNDLSDPEAKYPLTVPSREYFTHKISKLGIGDPDTYAVVYDRGAEVGNSIASADWASRLAWQIRYEGFENVAVLDGGLPKWQSENKPVTDEVNTYPQAEFTGERNDSLFSTKEDVKKALHDDNVVIINSLDPETYKGSKKTYACAGHIPGSVNVFFGNHSDPETKALLDDDEIRKTFENIGALDPDKKVITYCGSGIAATWNGTILNKLGQDNVSVYDGSLTEWTDDPTLPLETEE